MIYSSQLSQEVYTIGNSALEQNESSKMNNSPIPSRMTLSVDSQSRSVTPDRDIKIKFDFSDNFITDRKRLEYYLDKVNQTVVKIKSDQSIYKNSQEVLRKLKVCLKDIDSEFVQLSSAIEINQNEIIKSVEQVKPELTKQSLPTRGSEQKKVILDLFSNLHKQYDKMNEFISLYKNCTFNFSSIKTCTKRLVTIIEEYIDSENKILDKYSISSANKVAGIQKNTLSLKSKIFGENLEIHDLDLNFFFNQFVNKDVEILLNERKQRNEDLKNVEKQRNTHLCFKNYLYSLKTLVNELCKQINLKAEYTSQVLSSKKHELINEKYSRNMFFLLELISKRLPEYVHYEQVRLNISLSKLEQKKKKKIEHQFLYEDTELVKQLEEINQEIKEHELLISKCKLEFEYISEQILQSFLYIFKKSSVSTDVEGYFRNNKAFSLQKTKEFVKDNCLVELFSHLFSMYFTLLNVIEDQDSKLCQMIKQLIDFIVRVQPSAGLNKDLNMRALDFEEIKPGKRKFDRLNMHSTNEPLNDVLSEMKSRRNKMTNSEVKANSKGLKALKNSPLRSEKVFAQPTKKPKKSNNSSSCCIS